LGLSFDEPAIECSFEDGRLVACKIFVKYKIFASLLVACSDGHRLLRIPGFVIGQGLIMIEFE
jgi:hypothetical protein